MSFVTDRNGNRITIGCEVKWYDPQEEYRDLSRTYVVYDIKGDDDDAFIYIADDFGESEVLPQELEII